ncbi:MAG TPA: phosphoribosyltransferase family protein, partial [bacterium]|nr:phosphoribosyltransferase family protein [bacterium]
WEGALREAVLAFKFGGRTGLAAPLGALVAHAAEQLPEAPERVVAVPMPAPRLAARGFNQAALLARAVGREMALPFDAAALVRRADAPRQARGSRATRAANVRDAFAADPRAVEGRVVLLVDDVLTTGATANAGARALRAAGARSVLVATVARATLAA